MAKVPVKLIKLQKDKPSTRLRFLEDKVERLHSPKKVWKNPGWALPTDGEVVELPEVKYDEATVIQVLEKPGRTPKITGSRRLKPRQRPWKKPSKQGKTLRLDPKRRRLNYKNRRRKKQRIQHQRAGGMQEERLR